MAFGPLDAGGPVIFFDRRLGTVVLGLGQEEIRPEGRSDDLARRVTAQERPGGGAMGVGIISGVVPIALDVVVLHDEIALVDDVRRAEGFVRLAEADIQQAHENASAGQPHLVEGADADLVVFDRTDRWKVTEESAHRWS